jgi:hypothetical protein
VSSLDPSSLPHYLSLTVFLIHSGLSNQNLAKHHGNNSEHELELGICDVRPFSIFNFPLPLLITPSQQHDVYLRRWWYLGRSHQPRCNPYARHLSRFSHEGASLLALSSRSTFTHSSSACRWYPATYLLRVRNSLVLRLLFSHSVFFPSILSKTDHPLSPFPSSHGRFRWSPDHLR